MSANKLFDSKCQYSHLHCALASHPPVALMLSVCFHLR